MFSQVLFYQLERMKFVSIVDNGTVGVEYFSGPIERLLNSDVLYTKFYP